MWRLQNHKGTTLQAAKSADVFIFVVVILLFMVKNQYQTLLQINDRECIFMAWNSCSQRWHPPFVENHSSSGWDAPDVLISDPTIVLVSDRTVGALVRIQPILNISLSTTDNASSASKCCVKPPFLLHYSLFETKLSSLSSEVDGGA